MAPESRLTQKLDSSDVIVYVLSIDRTLIVLLMIELNDDDDDGDVIVLVRNRGSIIHRIFYCSVRLRRAVKKV